MNEDALSSLANWISLLSGVGILGATALYSWATWKQLQLQRNLNVLISPPVVTGRNSDDEGPSTSVSQELFNAGSQFVQIVSARARFFWRPIEFLDEGDPATIEILEAPLTDPIIGSGRDAEIEFVLPEEALRRLPTHGFDAHRFVSVEITYQLSTGYHLREFRSSVDLDRAGG